MFQIINKIRNAYRSLFINDNDCYCFGSPKDYRKWVYELEDEIRDKIAQGTLECDDSLLCEAALLHEQREELIPLGWPEASIQFDS